MTKNQIEKLKKHLFSNDIKQVSDSLKIIETEGDSSVIKILAEALITNDNITIKNEIRHFFAKIKSNDTAKYIVQIIEDKRFISEKKFFVSLCWQLPLQFDEFYDNFLQIFTNDNFEIAFEAFTVIEIIMDNKNVSNKTITEQLNKLNACLPKLDNQKKLLATKLIHKLK